MILNITHHSLHLFNQYRLFAPLRLNICMANLPLTDGCQQREAKRCQDLLLAACRSIPPADVFRGRLLEIIQKAGGLTALHKALSES